MSTTNVYVEFIDRPLRQGEVFRNARVVRPAALLNGSADLLIVESLDPSGGLPRAQHFIPIRNIYFIREWTTEEDANDAYF